MRKAAFVAAFSIDGGDAEDTGFHFILFVIIVVIMPVTVVIAVVVIVIVVIAVVVVAVVGFYFVGNQNITVWVVSSLGFDLGGKFPRLRCNGLFGASFRQTPPRRNPQ